LKKINKNHKNAKRVHQPAVWHFLFANTIVVTVATTFVVAVVVETTTTTRKKTYY
jgi:p-aminobenzoyl-glutamate transporter AbgT